MNFVTYVQPFDSFNIHRTFQPLPPQVIPCPKVLLSVSLPQQRYKTVKVVPIPFDKRMCDNGIFDCLDSALSFIGRHCLHHHGNFTKQLAKIYLPFCRVMSFERGEYYVPTGLKKAEFEASFSRAQQTNGVSS